MNTIPSKLTKRKIAVAQLMADGYNSKKAAEKLGVNFRVIESHMLQMRKMMGAKNSIHLIAILMRKKKIK